MVWCFDYLLRVFLADWWRNVFYRQYNAAVGAIAGAFILHHSLKGWSVNSFVDAVIQNYSSMSEETLVLAVQPFFLAFICFY